MWSATLAVLRSKVIMAGNYGKSLNQIFDVLAEWNTYLEEYCPDIYINELIDFEP